MAHNFCHAAASYVFTLRLFIANALTFDISQRGIDGRKATSLCIFAARGRNKQQKARRSTAPVNRNNTAAAYHSSASWPGQPGGLRVARDLGCRMQDVTHGDLTYGKTAARRGRSN